MRHGNLFNIQFTWGNINIRNHGDRTLYQSIYNGFDLNFGNKDIRLHVSVTLIL